MEAIELDQRLRVLGTIQDEDGSLQADWNAQDNRCGASGTRQRNSDVGLQLRVVLNVRIPHDCGSNNVHLLRLVLPCQRNVVLRARPQQIAIRSVSI